MPKRIPAQTITVVRDGKIVMPEIGKPFNFTAEEVEDVNRLNPNAFAKTRTVDADEDDEDDTTAAATGAKPRATVAARKAATEGL